MEDATVMAKPRGWDLACRLTNRKQAKIDSRKLWKVDVPKLVRSALKKWSWKGPGRVLNTIFPIATTQNSISPVCYPTSHSASLNTSSRPPRFPGTDSTFPVAGCGGYVDPAVV